nr:reverse transcriptase domain-containing protein [Tanacetum cinerariifolium]GEX50244.1 reverse transcriptase domain-containing protein [Tanacetum cinerariifolium]
MSTRSSARNLFPPLDNPELTIRKRSRADPTLLNDFEMAAEGNGNLPVPGLQTIEELCQPSLNGRGGPIAPISIQATNFRLKNDMIQQPPLAKPRTYMLREPIKVILTNHKFMKMNTALSSVLGTLPGNTITNPKEQLKGITTHSRTAYQGPMIPTTSSSLPLVVERETNVTKDKPVVAPIIEPVVAPVSAQKPNQRPLIPYPSRFQDQKLRDKANDQREIFFQIFKDLNFNISFTDALILMPKFGPTIKTLLTNKDKLSELVRASLNEHCSAVLLKKFPEKLGDPDKFLIPCDFLGMVECLALTDLGASINLMPLSVWNKLSLPDLSPTFVDFDADPRAPLILGRSFLKTERALIDVFEGELTLRVGKEAITFNLDQTLTYSANYNDMTEKLIDVIDMACDEYSQEVLSFSDVIASGNPTPYYDPIVSTTSLTLTPFGESDFLLEEVDTFVALEDDPTSPEVDQSYFDPEGDILLIEAFLNDDPLLPPPNQGNYLPQVQKELKICEAKTDKSSIDEPPEVELKDLPPHLKYAFLEGDDTLPVIILKDLSVEEKAALITVLKSYKRAIAWKLSDLMGINPEFFTHKILMEDDFKLAVQHQRRVNPKIHDVIKNEVLKLLDAGLIYPISDGPWIARLMTCLLEKDIPFFFSKECVEAYQTLKRKLTEAPILIAPDWDLSFQLMCDASDFAIGAVLGQHQEKHFRPIHYASKTMTEAESNYNTTKKEMLAMVFGTPRAIISDRGTHFCNDQFAKVMLKYGFTHRLATAYHPQTSGQVEVSNRGLKRILERTTVGDHRKVQLNELNELCDQAYENSLIYKEKTKRLHDSKIKDHVFHIGDQVLLFNSRLKIFSGKLKTRWSGPFTVSHVFPYDTVELSQTDGPNFKVNGHRLKHYFGEDIPKMVVPDLQTFSKD